MGQLDNTIVVFTTDNGAEAITFPDGGATPFKGQKGEAWEGGYRAPAVVRWPGAHRAGHGQEPAVRGAGLAAHLCRHRRRAQGRRAEEADRGRPIPGHRQDHAGWRRPDRLPDGQVREVGARPLLLLLRRRHRRRCATRTGRCTTPCPARRAGWVMPLIPFHLTLVSEHQARPFEPAVGDRREDGDGLGRRARRPGYGLSYDWNMLPIGQQLWEKDLLTYIDVPAAAGPGDLQPLPGS